MEDEIVNEIHETRQRIFEECGGDVERFIDRLKTLDVAHKDRLVTIEQVEERSRTGKATT